MELVSPAALQSLYVRQRVVAIHPLAVHGAVNPNFTLFLSLSAVYGLASGAPWRRVWGS